MAPILIIIFILLLILVLAALLLLIPFHFSFKLEKDGPLMEGFYRVACLGLTLRQGTLPPPQLSEMEAPIEEEKAEAVIKEEIEEKGKGKKSEGSRAPIELKTLIEAMPAVTKVLRNMAKSLKFETLSCKVAFGLDDPADTAAMSGYIWAAFSALGQGKADIFIEPSFGGARLDGTFLAEIRARMLWFFAALIGGLFEKKIRILAWKMATGATA